MCSYLLRLSRAADTSKNQLRSDLNIVSEDNRSLHQFC